MTNLARRTCSKSAANTIGSPDAEGIAPGTSPMLKCAAEFGGSLPPIESSSIAGAATEIPGVTERLQEDLSKSLSNLLLADEDAFALAPDVLSIPLLHGDTGVSLSGLSPTDFWRLFTGEN